MNRQLYDYTTKENIAPITNTEAVMTPGGQTAEQRNTEQMNAIKGVESIGDASVYPFLHVGNYTLEGANAKLNSLFRTTDSKYQGKLKLVVDEQTLWVEQYAINLAEGKWMQVAYGPFTVASDNKSLVRENTKVHISYRKNDGSADVLWKDFSTTGISLKTINGQSIVGEGNINVTEQGIIVLDTALDSTSENGVQNKVICNAINLVKNRIASLERKEAMLPFKDVLDLGFSPECQPGGFDGSGGSIVYDPIEKRFLISIDSDTYFSAWSAMGDRASSNDYNPQIGFYYTTIRDGNNKENHSLRIYHWSKQKGNLVSTDEWTDRYFSAIICPQYWGDEYPEDGVLGNYWYNPTTNILYQYRETKDGKVWEQIETLQRILCNPDTSELIAQINGEDPYRLLTEKDLDNIEGKLEVILVKHWEGAGPTEWTVGDYALDDDVLKVCTAVTGNVPTLETVDAAGRVLILCNDINRKLYQYVDGDAPEQIALIRDLKSIKSIVTPKYWGDTPGDAKVSWSKGEYWLDTSSNKLRVCTMAGSGSEALFDEADFGRILVRDSVGKLYDMDNSTGVGPRLLNENDLSDINTKINKLPGEKAYPFEGIVNSILGYEAELPTKVGKVVYVKKSSKGNPLNKFLLEVEVSTTPKLLMYYSKWNANHTALGLDSSIYANVHKDLWYTVDSSRLIIYHWSSSDGGLVPTGGGTSDVSVKTEGNNLSINNNNISFATVNGQPVLNGSAIVIESGETEVIPTDNPLYPEYYLTTEEKANIKYAPEYHKWPLVWYGGKINEGTINTEDTLNEEVFMPGEWMFADHGLDKKWSNNVLFYEPGGFFVLLHTYIEEETGATRTVYYKKWKNSYLYNSPDTGKPNIGTVYVKQVGLVDNTYSKGTERSPQNGRRPDTYIWNGFSFINPFLNITNFKDAFTRCAYANKGNLLLRPGKLYYIEIDMNVQGVDSSNYWSEYKPWQYGVYNRSTREPQTPTQEPVDAPLENFIVDGQGGGILFRNTAVGESNSGHTSSLFDLSNVRHGIIRNITVAALRDNFEGGPSNYLESEPRLSCAGSNLRFVSIYDLCSDILFENIETFGMHHDFYIKNYGNSYNWKTNQNIHIKNFKSTLVNGNVVRDVSGFVLDNYDVLQAGYIDGGDHTIYFQVNPGVCVIRNCKFRLSAPYRQVMFGSHGYNSNVPQTILRVCSFENCDITGAAMVGQGNNFSKICFTNCTIRVTDEMAGGARGLNPLGKGPSIGGDTGTTWIFKNCSIFSPAALLGCGGPTRRYQRLILDNCSFIRTRKENGSIDTTTGFVQNFYGQYIKKDCKVFVSVDSTAVSTNNLLEVTDKLLNLGGGTDISAEAGIEANNTKCLNINKILSGNTEIVSEPKYIGEIGDKYCLPPDGKVYECTGTGKHSRISMNFTTGMIFPYTGWANRSISLQLSEDEIIPLCESDPDLAFIDKKDMIDFIVSALQNAGYSWLSEDSLKPINNHEDKAGSFEVTRDQKSIIIIPKYREPFTYYTGKAFINASDPTSTIPGFSIETSNSKSCSVEGTSTESGIVTIKISPQGRQSGNNGAPLAINYTSINNVIISLGPNENIVLHGSSDADINFKDHEIGLPANTTVSRHIGYFASKLIDAGYTCDNGQIANGIFTLSNVEGAATLRPYSPGHFTCIRAKGTVNVGNKNDPTTWYKSKDPQSAKVWEPQEKWAIWYLCIKAKNPGYSWEYCRTHNASYYSSYGSYSLNNTDHHFYIMNLLGSDSEKSSLVDGVPDIWIEAKQEEGLVARIVALEEATGTMFSAYVSQVPQEPIAEGTYWFEFNQDSQSEGQLKKYTSDGWENVSGTRILYDAGDGQTSQSLYLCINGTSIKKITLTNV